MVELQSGAECWLCTYCCCWQGIDYPGAAEQKHLFTRLGKANTNAFPFLSSSEFNCLPREAPCCFSCKHLLRCPEHHGQKAQEVTNNINKQHLNLTSTTVVQSLLSKSSLFKIVGYVFNVFPLKEMLLVSSLWGWWDLDEKCSINSRRS